MDAVQAASVACVDAGAPELGAEPLVPPVREGRQFLRGTGFGSWLNDGRTLAGGDRARPWSWGDWLLEGEALGEVHSQAFSVDDAGYVAIGGVETGLKMPAFNQWAWVASRFPPDTRVIAPKVYWSHHRAVAALDSDEERRHWLMRVRDEGLTVSALQALLKPSVEADRHACPECGAVHRRKPPDGAP